MDSQWIKLYEIDPDAIVPIRGLNTESESYKGLEISITQDGQKNPIIVRRLTDAEKSKAAPGAIYGIIDGHHRYNIAKTNNFDAVLANIENRENSDENDYLDKVLAYRLNEAAIRMSSLEKGKVIYELIKLTGKDIPEIGKAVFNLEQSMSYRIVHTYKKSIGDLLVRKPHASKFDDQVLKDAIKKLPTNPKNLKIKSREDCEEKLQAIKTAQLHLNRLKVLIERNMPQ